MVSQQKRVLIAALVVFAVLLVIAIKTNGPPPATQEEATTATQIAKAPSDIEETKKDAGEPRQAVQDQPDSAGATATVPSEPTSAERPAAESAAQPDKPAEQSPPKSAPQAIATPAPEKPEPSARPDLAKPETVEQVVLPEESKPARRPRFVEIGADKCIPCIMMQPILDELRDEYAGKLQVDFVDVWKHPEQSAKYGIQTIPTQVIYDSSGKEVFRHIGFYPKDEILAKFKELGIDLE